MNGFSVPFGVNETGQLVSAAHASKEDAYHCPSCATVLVFKAGEQRAKHFAHKTVANCSPEAAVHKIAKRLVVEAINHHSSQPVLIDDACDRCQGDITSAVPASTFASAAEEQAVGPFICDVLAQQTNGKQLAIEIKNTHAVDERKAKELAVPWLELEAEAVLNNPNHWQPIQRNTRANYCQSCKPRAKAIYGLAKQAKIDPRIFTPAKSKPKKSYVADTETCYRCKKDTLVYWWAGVPFCETEPPEPRPANIEYRYSKQYGGKYWACVCQHCNALQGDNFLHLFPNGPFFALQSEFEEAQSAGVEMRRDIDVDDMVNTLFRGFRV